MRCPRCSFEGELIDGACVQCGYRRVSVSKNLRNATTPTISSTSGLLHAQSGPLSSPSLPEQGVSRPLQGSTSLTISSAHQRALVPVSRPLLLRSGDILNQGRYRLIDQMVLPDNQQGQGTAWLAIDSSSGNTQVVLREVIVPEDERANRQRIVRAVALRLSEITQHPGLPKVLNVFNEQNAYFIVLQHIEGESLASLLRRQGGALPERTVAEYGRQLCEILTILSRHQAPLVHGAISPETVIISPDRSQVHLIHLPLFPPKELASTASVAEYKAPEQARGIVDASSDLYSVAATLHHAVTGFDPRERISFFYPPARRLNPVISMQMETILTQELRLSATQRYARASDMQGELAALLMAGVTEAERLPALISKEPTKLDSLQMRRDSRQHSFIQVSVFGGICLVVLLVLLFFSYIIFPSLKSSTSVSLTPNPTATMAAMTKAQAGEWQAELPVYQSRQIGISDGRYAFDTYAGRPSPEVQDKKQAAQALLNNDLATASTDYQEAATYDRTDAEALIYAADLRLEIQNDAYVTIVLGLPIDSSSADLAISRADMQSAYEFQQQVNAKNVLPQGLKLRILIANSGANSGDVTTIAQYIAKRVQLGNLDRIIAVVGWPKSSESLNAVSILTAAKIPIISQTASSTALNSISSYFFRVNPNDTAQGQAQGTFAYTQLHARKVLVLRDPTDSYSQSLADAFTASFTKLGGTVVNDASDNFTESQTTVEEYEQIVRTIAESNHADLIFMPGFDDDAIRLAHALGQEAHIYSYWLATLKILGGDGFDTSLLLGQGDGADATLAQEYPSDMQRLVFTSFASSAAWGSNPQSQQTAFLSAWANLYGTASTNNPNPPVPINTAIMVNDAFGVIGYAIGQVQGSLTGAHLRNALAKIGTGSSKAYQGLSGQIAFGEDGNALNKALVILEVVASPTTGLNIIKPWSAD
jgi:eukaryotic-like serine/threonine-protein kinase